jgi:uncharacterized protein (DUF885 family)
MNRRQFIGSGASALLLTQTGCTTTSGPPAASPDARLKALLDEFFEEQLAERPETATQIGLDTGARAHLRSKLIGVTRGDRDRWVEAHRSRLARLRAFPEAGLSRTGRFDRAAVLWRLERVVEGGTRFRFGEAEDRYLYAPYSPYAVSQLSGPHQSVPELLDSFHPVASAGDAEAYLERLSIFSRRIDDAMEAMNIDAAAGVLPPDFALDGAIVQLGRLRAPAASEHGLVSSLVRRAATAGLAGDWTNRATAIVERQIYPALDRQLAAARRLRQRATSDAGVWKLPDGEAYYAGALRFQTTTGLSPAEVFAIGERQVAELEGQLDPLLRSLGLTQGSVGQRLVALSIRPDQLFPNDASGRAAVIAYMAERMSALRPRLTAAFNVRPTAPMEIVRVPPEIEDGAPGGYASPPSFDGSRPDRFFINLKTTADWPRFSLPTLAFHEGMPGHLWHGATLALGTDRPMMRRLREGYAAYSEGWALYTEQLADELGIYDEDMPGRIGFLQSMLFRAVRLVVDTGLHARRWSRDRAADYFVEHTGRNRAPAVREVNRYAVWPGQACSYKVGHNEWVRLREVARAAGGAQFDLRRYHDLLTLGSRALQVLDDLVRSTDWA